MICAVALCLLSSPLHIRYQANSGFISQVHHSYAKKDWKRFILLLRKAVDMVEAKFSQCDERLRQKGQNDLFSVELNQEGNETIDTSKESSLANPIFRQQWKELASAVAKFEMQKEQVKNNFAFSFVEGTLVKAVKEGSWVLLDEINLASGEALQVCILYSLRNDYLEPFSAP